VGCKTLTQSISHPTIGVETLPETEIVGYIKRETGGDEVQDMATCFIRSGVVHDRHMLNIYFSRVNHVGPVREKRTFWLIRKVFYRSYTFPVSEATMSSSEGNLQCRLHCMKITTDAYHLLITI